MQQDLDLDKSLNINDLGPLDSNEDDYITIIAKKPIHILGINAGETITLNYTWDDIEDLMDHMSKGFIWVLSAENEHLLLDNWLPNLDDIFEETTEITDSIEDY